MPGAARPNLGAISGWANQEGGWGVDMNANLNRLDSLVMASIKDKDLTSPPGSPTDGDRYIVGPSASGAWSTHDGKVAVRDAGAWVFYSPKKGWRTYIEDEGLVYAHTGTVWLVDEFVIPVTRFGVKPDGTDQASAINTAITAAQAAKAILLFPPAATAYVSSGGHVVKRDTRIYGYGAKLQLNAGSGTLLTFGSGTTGITPAGGLVGLWLVGNAGGSDTSIGLQIGNSTADAFNMTFRDIEVEGFGHGIVLTGDADEQIFIDGFMIRDNAFNGIRIDTTSAAEQNFISNGFIVNNGGAQSTGAGIQYSSGAKMDLVLTTVTINGNGNGGRGQIYGPTDATAQLTLTGVDFEHAVTNEAIMVELLGHTDNRSRLNMHRCTLGDFNTGSTHNKPLMLLTSVDLFMFDVLLSNKLGSTVVPHINIGNSTSAKENFVVGRGVKFEATGTVANAQAIAWTGSGGAFGALDITGSILRGFDTATTPITVPEDLRCCHDIVVSGGAWKPGTRKMVDLYLMWDQDLDRQVRWNLDHLTYASSATIYSLKIGFMNAQVGIKVPVVASGNLFGAGADHDGMIVIEDAGAGDRNLILYAGGQRFRIDGGANV